MKRSTSSLLSGVWWVLLLDQIRGFDNELRDFGAGLPIARVSKRWLSFLDIFWRLDEMMLAS